MFGKNTKITHISKDCAIFLLKIISFLKFIKCWREKKSVPLQIISEYRHSDDRIETIEV